MQPVKEWPAIRRTALRHIVGRATEIHDIDDSCLVGIPKEDGFTAREQLEPELTWENPLFPTKKTARGNHGAVGDTKFIRQRIVAQPGAGQVHRIIAVIIEFDPIHWIAVIVEFI